MQRRVLLLFPVLATVGAFAPSPHRLRVAPARPAVCRCAPIVASASASAEVAARTVVVTDMDETLISKKSTGYVISFLVRLRSIRLLLVPLVAAVLIPVSKLSRTFAVRVMYWFAFRGVRVERAKAIAAEFLAPRYAADLQDPVASAVLAADDAIVITASPDFMARPWLERYLRVPPSQVYGAVLEERAGRFTGKTTQIPIGEEKATLLASDPLATSAGVSTVGYGDHPTDVPFMKACDRAVLVHPMEPMPPGVEYEPAQPFDSAALG